MGSSKLTPESKSSLLPHWDGKVYTRYAARFYDRVTILSGWRKKVIGSALKDLSHRTEKPGDQEPARLLDVGCGTCFVLNKAVESGFDAFGLDSSTGMLAQAPLKQTALSNRLIAASAESLPFPNGCFDVVIASGSLVHIPAILAASREIMRVTRPGGTIRIIDHARPRNPGIFTPMFSLFSQLSGDIIHDYAHYFSDNCHFEKQLTLGRGGYLQLFDFVKR
ncbi:MAG: class I SAM-dependent methyltransferase [Nitrospira sp.]|nr:methyltransferase domain-containing protein [Candidatus Manganitrophaceae bacterium]HIL33987.1 methyltransferase domain-containing protein [Candidatus Manganitrophaceae bacterium]